MIPQFECLQKDCNFVIHILYSISRTEKKMITCKYNGIFLINTENPISVREIWKLKIPLYEQQKLCEGYLRRLTKIYVYIFHVCDFMFVMYHVKAKLVCFLTTVA